MARTGDASGCFRRTRTRGVAQSTDEAKSKDNYTNAKAAYLKAKESELVLPEWTKGWINPPDREQFRQVMKENSCR